MRVLAIIPARGGSKGVPGKNIKNLALKEHFLLTIEELFMTFSQKRELKETQQNEKMKI